MVRLLQALVIVGTFASFGMCPTVLKQAWDEAIVEEVKPFQPLSREDLSLIESLFRRTLHASEQTKQLDSLLELWQIFGFTLQEYKSEDETFWLLRKTEPELPGEGVFLFRVAQSQATHSTLLQAPHSVSDFHTGEIAFELFSVSKAKAAAWNSRPRKTVCRDGCTDLTHRDDSAFHALTLAFAKEVPHSTTVQLHGFSQEKRRSAAGQEAEIIVSSGSLQMSPRAVRIVEALRKSFEGHDVKLFGAKEPEISIAELGATLNLQNRDLRALDYEGFLHLEFCRETREQLKTSKSKRALLLGCIEELEEFSTGRIKG